MQPIPSASRYHLWTTRSWRVSSCTAKSFHATSSPGAGLVPGGDKPVEPAGDRRRVDVARGVAADAGVGPGGDVHRAVDADADIAGPHPVVAGLHEVGGGAFLTGARRCRGIGADDVR